MMQFFLPLSMEMNCLMGILEKRKSDGDQSYIYNGTIIVIILRDSQINFTRVVHPILKLIELSAIFEASNTWNILIFLPNFCHDEGWKSEMAKNQS